MTGLLDRLVVEPWLGLSRWTTVGVLHRRLARVSARSAVPAAASAVPGDRQGLLYVAASTRPYHSSGYTARTQAVLTALHEAGLPFSACTRPGYPWDRFDRLGEPEAGQTHIADVRYQHLRNPGNRRPVLFYALQAAPVLARLAAERGVARIHAASNHVNALPALLAARRLGLPFQYEMRGLWELTRVSRQPGFGRSQAFRQGLALEALVARHADRLFVISDQLGRYVSERWGVPAERIALLPNCVSPDHFAVADATQMEPATIAYAGSLIGYEGLDTLIEAVARLRTSNNPAVPGLQLRIAGDGEARADLEALARRLDVAHCVHFLGRLAPEEAHRVVHKATLVCLPRKPWEVCRIVPPLKLVEALAMGKPVVVPDLPVFRDELGAQLGTQLGDTAPGWFFEAGNAADLARVLAQALADGEGRARRGAQARAHAVKTRNWADFVPRLLEA